MNQTVFAEDRIAEARQPTQISWGAIFAGWVLANGIAWLLYTLGSAVGLSIAGATSVSGGGMAAGVAIWVFLTWVAALFMGGLFAGRLAGKADRAVGAMHGMTVWGLATIVTVILGMMGINNLLQTGQSIVSGAMGTAAAGTGAAASSGSNTGGGNMANTAAEDAIKTQISKAVAAASEQGNATGARVSPGEARKAIDEMPPQALSQMASRLMSGDTTGARHILESNTNLTRAQVDQVMSGLSNQASSTKQDVKHAAGKAAEYSALTLGVIFVSSAVGLAMSILGGWLGAASVSRIYGYRLY